MSRGLGGIIWSPLWYHDLAQQDLSRGLHGVVEIVEKKGGKLKKPEARPCPGVWAVCLIRKRQRGGKGGNLAPKALSRGLGCNERSLLQNIALNSAHVFVERQHLELYS